MCKLLKNCFSLWLMALTDENNSEMLWFWYFGFGMTLCLILHLGKILSFGKIVERAMSKVKWFVFNQINCWFSHINAMPFVWSLNAARLNMPQKVEIMADSENSPFFSWTIHRRTFQWIRFHSRKAGNRMQWWIKRRPLNPCFSAANRWKPW